MAGFQTLVNEALTGAMTAEQWGNAVPIHPALFQKNLMGLADAENIDWPGQDDSSAEVQAANNAVIKYSIFYQHLLEKVQYEPEPSNPTTDFDLWWQAQKKVVGS